MPIAQYAMGNGGKRLRPLLTVLVARLLGYADNDIYSLAAAMEMFHVATLLHDDVMDNAEMRRGSTATHKVFGVTETILAGDALLAKGNQIVAGFGDPRLTAATSDAIAQTANGEILEIANQGDVYKRQLFRSSVDGTGLCRGFRGKNLSCIRHPGNGLAALSKGACRVHRGIPHAGRS